MSSRDKPRASDSAIKADSPAKWINNFDVAAGATPIAGYRLQSVMRAICYAGLNASAFSHDLSRSLMPQAALRQANCSTDSSMSS